MRSIPTARSRTNGISVFGRPGPAGISSIAYPQPPTLLPRGRAGLWPRFQSMPVHNVVLPIPVHDSAAQGIDSAYYRVNPLRSAIEAAKEDASRLTCRVVARSALCILEC